MCGVSLGDGMLIEDLYSFLGIQNVFDVVRHVRWFEHLEHKSGCQAECPLAEKLKVVGL